MTTLLYDDDQTMAGLYMEIAKQKNIPLIAVRTINEALEYFVPGSIMPDVLISDLSAREQSNDSIADAIREKFHLDSGTFGSNAAGTELIKAARAVHPACRIIIFGGEGVDPTTTKLKVWGHIEKPPHIEVMIETCRLGPLTATEQRRIENGMHIPVDLDVDYFDHIRITREVE